MEARHAQTASVSPQRGLVKSCAYLLLGGGLLGFLFAGAVPLGFGGPVAAAAGSYRCGRPTLRGTACMRLVRVGNRCPYHPVGARGAVLVRGIR